MYIYIHIICVRVRISIWENAGACVMYVRWYACMQPLHRCMLTMHADMVCVHACTCACIRYRCTCVHAKITCLYSCIDVHGACAHRCTHVIYGEAKQRGNYVQFTSLPRLAWP